MAVEGTIPDCELQTVVEYWDEFGCDYSANMDSSASSTPDECNGAWYHWFDPLAYFDIETMSIDWPLNQQHWFDFLSYQAIYSNREVYEELMKTGTIDTFKPKKYSFRLRFKTYNPIC